MSAVENSKFRNPLEPLRSAVRLLYYIVVPLGVVGLLIAVFTGGGSFGWNGGWVRLEAPAMLPVDGVSSPTSAWLRTAATLNSSGQFTIHMSNASTFQAFCATLVELPAVLLFLSGLVLAMRLMRHASKNGVYTMETARKLRFLGWTLLLGTVTVTVLRVVGSIGLLHTMLLYRVSAINHWTDYVHLSWTLLFTGLGLITFARIMRVGVDMREDLDGTV